MNFDFTEEQKLFAESVRRFAQAHLTKDAIARAHKPGFPFDVAKLMSQQGLLGITIPEADGGQGGSLMDAVIAIEQTAAVCPRSADIVQFGNFGPIRTFSEYGSDHQKKKWLTECLAGNAVISLGMSEPEAGSAVTDLKTTAKQDGTGQRLRSQQQSRCGDIGAIGETERDGRWQAVFLAGLADEIRKFICTLAHIVLVEHALCEPSEEARHAAFQHLAARRQQGRARCDDASKINQVVFVAAGAVQQQKRRQALLGGRLEAVNERQFGRGGHGGPH